MTAELDGFDHDARLQQEWTTVLAMIRLYCRGKHGRRDGLCPACRELASYARRRLARCPYGPSKPTCAKCPIHCYNAGMRRRIREVMRYAGPRMLFHHPVLAVRHMLHGLQRTPELPGRPGR